MPASNVFARVSRIHPALVLPAIGGVAWFAAGLLPGNGARPAQAMAEHHGGGQTGAVNRDGLSDTLPDRIPSTLSAALSPAVGTQLPYAPSSQGGSSSGGDSGSSNGGAAQKHAAQQPHEGRSAVAEDRRHDHAHDQAGSYQHSQHQQAYRAGQQAAPVASPRPRIAFAAPPAPAPHVAATVPFPFFGGIGGQFTPRANPGGGHFGGGGGRHR